MEATWMRSESDFVVKTAELKEISAFVALFKQFPSAAAYNFGLLDPKRNPTNVRERCLQNASKK
jgi:hypothetical protein